MQEARRNLENCQCKGRKEKEIYEKAVKTLMFTGKVLRNQTNNLIGRNKTAEEVNLYHGDMNMEKVLPQELRIARARNIENWRQGKVLAVDDKVIWVRDGSEIYRVSTDMAAHPVLNGLGGARVQPEVHRPDDPDEREEGDHHSPCQTNSMTESN